MLIIRICYFVFLFLLAGYGRLHSCLEDNYYDLSVKCAEAVKSDAMPSEVQQDDFISQISRMSSSSSSSSSSRNSISAYVNTGYSLRSSYSNMPLSSPFASLFNSIRLMNMMSMLTADDTQEQQISRSSFSSQRRLVPNHKQVSTTLLGNFERDSTT
jgi:hypothetical protein